MTSPASATYRDRQELRQEFPELEDEDIQQALIFIASYLDDRIVELPKRAESHRIFAFPIYIVRLRERVKHHHGCSDR